MMSVPADSEILGQKILHEFVCLLLGSLRSISIRLWGVCIPLLKLRRKIPSYRPSPFVSNPIPTASFKWSVQLTSRDMMVGHLLKKRCPLLDFSYFVHTHLEPEQLIVRYKNIYSMRGWRALSAEGKSLNNYANIYIYIIVLLSFESFSRNLGIYFCGWYPLVYGIYLYQTEVSTSI